MKADLNALEHGKFNGIGSARMHQGELAWQAGYDEDGNMIYLGYAEIGAATSAAVWQIRKYAYDGTDPVSCTWADGDPAFDNVWDDRASLTYL